MCGSFEFGPTIDPWGRPLVAPWKQREGQHLLDELAAMYAVGVRAVRWFLLGSGSTFGCPRYLDRNRFGPGTGAEARAFRSNDRANWYAAGAWGFDVPPTPACRVVVDDFVRMLRLVQRFNDEREERRRDPLRILPSWVDFRFFLGPGQLRLEWFSPNANDRANYNFGDPYDVELWFSHRVLPNEPMVAGGHMDVLLDPRQRRAFYQRLVVPMLEAVTADEGLRDQVLYWEVGNELDAMLMIRPEHRVAGARSWDAIPALTRAIYRFISEMVLLHRGAAVPMPGGAALRARVRRPLRTTMGWLRWDTDAGLRQSLLDRAWMHRHRSAATGPVAVEDVLQFHAYMSMHPDPTPTVYVARGDDPEATFTPGLATWLGRAPFCDLVPPSTYGGWRAWPMASELRQFAVDALGPDLHALMGFAPDVAVSVDTDAQIPCVVGEMHLLPASGDPGEGRPPERWVKHFSLPWPLGLEGAFNAVPVRWEAARARYERKPPRDLGARLSQEVAWVYHPELDTLTGRLCLLHTLGYSWALPWAWNVGPTERPLEHFLSGEESLLDLVESRNDLRARLYERRQREAPIEFWRRLRLGEQLRGYHDAVASQHG
jgi:hypothetical protein